MISGPTRGILTAERVALNFLCHLSRHRLDHGGDRRARSTATRARVVCTRKTTPGLRAVQKYAVRVGGGFNHRFGLDDGVLIKDNHIAAAGSLAEAVARDPRRDRPPGQDRARGRYARSARGGAGARASTRCCSTTCRYEEMRRAVALVGGRVLTEASGRITPASAPGGCGDRRRSPLERRAHPQQSRRSISASTIAEAATARRGCRRCCRRWRPAERGPSRASSCRCGRSARAYRARAAR